MQSGSSRRDPGVTPTFYVEMGCASKLLQMLVLCGGEGQNRTVDTTIFSRMLYQLSYLADTKRGNW